METIAINETTVGSGGLSSDPAKRDPDSDILPALMSHDQRAFATLMDRHIRSLSALSAQMLGDMHLAEDITQSVFLKTWQMLPNWQTGNAKLITWMRRVATNMCLDHLRKKKPIYTDTVPEQAGSEPLQDETMASTERSEQMFAAMGLLPERQKAALTLFYYQELPQKQCAHIMELTVPAFESLLRRSRQALKKTLNPQMAQS